MPQSRRNRLSLARRRLLVACVAVKFLLWPAALAAWLMGRRPATLADREAAQTASMELVRDISIDGVAIEDYCKKRCYLLWSTPPGEYLLNVTPPALMDDGTPRPLSLSPEEFSRALNATFDGTCASITNDGYLVTAAHCVQEGRDLWIILPYANGITTRKARVVKAWDGSADFAILKIEDIGTEKFPLGDPDAVEPGSIVMAGGMRTDNTGREIRFDFAVPVVSIAGRVKQVAPIAEQPGFHEVTSDLPLIRGFSGGPVVDTAGRLVAINTRSSNVRRLFPSAPATGYAVGLKAAEIEQTIAADRQR